MKISDEITASMYNYLQVGRTADIVLPNFYIGLYEMDIMKLHKSGYISEFEIKISRSDFLSDFKKSFNGNNKHDRMAKGEGYCNRFMFVVPKDLISINEVPRYAGLAYWYKDSYSGRGWINIIKAAPIIHKNKHFTTAEDFHQLAYKVSFRENNFRLKVNNLKKKLTQQ